MENKGLLQVTTPSDREIALTRVFDAPRGLVFEAYTKPELLKRWLGVPHDGWSLEVCEVDLRVGGKCRFVSRGPDGNEMAMSGVYREVVPGERIVTTELFDNPWYEGGAVKTVTFEEQAGKTTFTLSVLYDSKEIRDGVLKSGMDEGMAFAFDMLAELFASMPQESR